tara:strand:- start:3589 stop:7248 length:3660 start_codon:yes stop_codon:yes gene_type:complete
MNQQGGILRATDDNVLQAGGARMLLSVMGNMESLYQDFLNHVDIKYLVAKLAACLGLEPTLIPCQLLDLIRQIADLLMRLANLDLSTFDFSSFSLSVFGDITEDLVNYMLQFLLNLVNMFITELYMALLAELDALCQEDFDYGAVDLSGLIDDNFDSPEEAAKFFGGLDSNLGDCGPGTVQEMIRDVSAFLTTSQFCSLIRGTATNSTLKRVHRVILLDKYSCLHERFNTLKKVGNFFSSMSGIVDLSFCEITAGIPDDAFTRMCATGFNEEARRAAYQDLDDITPEQIEQQLAAERQRRLDLLTDITNIVNSNEDSLTNNLIKALQDPNGPAGAVAEHPATSDVIQQMIDTVFVNPATILINEGIGVSKTPYTTVQYMATTEAGQSILKSEGFAVNKGIMNIISDNDEHYFYKYGATSGFSGTRLTNDKFGDGIADQLSWINLNESTIPTPSAGLAVTAVQLDDSWIYKAKLYPKTGGSAYSTRPHIVYRANYGEGFRRQVPSWWEVDSEHHMDVPKIKALFIQRSPLAGIPRGEKVDGVRIDLPGPVLNHFVDRDRTLIGLSHARYISHHQVKSIPIFNDLPKVIEEGLVPKYDELIIEPAGTKQQTTYINLIAKSFRSFTTRFHPEGTPLTPTSSTSIESYQCTFNDVMRILYRFVSDSEFYTESATEDMLTGLKDTFRDPDKLMELLGISGDLEQIIQEGIANTLVSDGPPSDATKSIIGEAALRFMIRIYILEIYLKNLYMLTAVPENRNELGKAVDPTNLEPLRVSNPFTGTSALKSKFYNKMLNLEDTLDPIMVSYIAEYIEFSDSRMEGDCAAFYDIAHELAEKKLEEEEPEDGFLFIEGHTGDFYVGDTLAYYPSKAGSEDDDVTALKYYIAKELKTFIKTFQDLIQLKNLHPEFSSNLGMRSLMKSFLDKFEIVGYNVEAANAFSGERSSGGGWWQNVGEGLYMQFYYRTSETSEEYFFDELNYLDEPFGDARPNRNLANDNRIGLRVCLRDSAYHPNGRDNITLMAGQQQIWNWALAGDSDDPALNSPRSWTPEMGFPVLEYETTWGEIKNATGVTTAKPYLNEKIRDRRKIVNHLKHKLMETDDFRVMFEYVFPVKKMFNLMFIMMDQNVSAFMLNGPIRGLKPIPEFPRDAVVDLASSAKEDLKLTRKSILRAANIDPEQFIQAKAVVKSILENVVNSDNYRYINAKTEAAGGQGKLAMKKQLEQS